MAGFTETQPDTKTFRVVKIRTDLHKLIRHESIENGSTIQRDINVLLLKVLRRKHPHLNLPDYDDDAA